jgi:hypothetical protein
MSVGVRGGHTADMIYRHGRARKNFMVGSWNDLATAGASEFLNSKAGEILSTSPQHTPSFLFTYIQGAEKTYGIPGSVLFLAWKN